MHTRRPSPMCGALDIDQHHFCPRVACGSSLRFAPQPAFQKPRPPTYQIIPLAWLAWLLLDRRELGGPTVRVRVQHSKMPCVSFQAFTRFGIGMTACGNSSIGSENSLDLRGTPHVVVRKRGVPMTLIVRIATWSTPAVACSRAVSALTRLDEPSFF